MLRGIFVKETAIAAKEWDSLDKMEREVVKCSEYTDYLSSGRAPLPLYFREVQYEYV
jgi:hypothetical protein